MIEIKKKDFQIIIKELEKDYLIDSFFDTFYQILLKLVKMFIIKNFLKRFWKK